MNWSALIFMAAALLGWVGMWLMLARASARLRILGLVLAAISLGLLASQVPGRGHWASSIVFYPLAGMAVVAAVATVTPRSPIRCAIWFAFCLLLVAGLLLVEGEGLPAVATVVVAAEVISGTLFFVLTPAQGDGRAPYNRTTWEPQMTALAGAILAGIVSATVVGALAGPQRLPRMGQGGALLADYLILGGLLFAVGLIGFLSRRNMLMTLLGAELMLQGVSVSLVAWGRSYSDSGGRTLALWIITVAAGEAAIGLALLRMLFRREGSLDVATWSELGEEVVPPWVDRELPERPVRSPPTCPWPLRGLARLSRLMDRYVLDGLVKLCGWVLTLVGCMLRSAQTGTISFYALAMVLGLLVLIVAVLR